MTTTTRNEAAERLRAYLKKAFGTREFEDGALDEALAAERRATVERIRERIEAEAIEDGTGKILPSRILYILSTEARR